MNIRGIHKTSLIDYPGKICSIFFSGGCNMRCRYCHNPELVMAHSYNPIVPNEEALAFVKKRKGFVDGVAISGGEPTLSKNLIPFLRSLRDIGISIKLDTNGLKPEVIRTILEENLVDYIALDIKTSPEKYGDLTAKEDAFPYVIQTLRIIQMSNIDYEVRTTCIPTYVEFDDIQKIAKEIVYVKRYYLQQFIPTKTLDKHISSINPFPIAVLQKYRAYLSNFANVCEIRGA
ncbi:MAG: anaerobic ribonucleoside-triphosphate reductase activating protein [Spirochaetes bacterium]|nr:anaerobic ribonucleoside-triphosphate reductase activating protein [Spirochaetota bacterium]